MSNKDCQFWPAILTFKRLFGGGITYHDDSSSLYKSSVDANFTLFSIIGWGIDLDYHDTEWFTLERNRDHSVIFEIAYKYCISELLF